MTGTKHMVTVIENEDFGVLIKAYEEWSGNTVTEQQRTKIFKAIVEEGSQDRLLNLVSGERQDTGMTYQGLDFLVSGMDNKNLDPRFY